MKKCGEEEKAWLVEEWEKSGKSKRAFAMELGLNVQTFTGWTRKGTERQGFVELSEKPGPGGRALFAVTKTLMCRETVVERGEVRIRLAPGATRAELTLVVQALG
jgi:transposase-like protein